MKVLFPTPVGPMMGIITSLSFGIHVLCDMVFRMDVNDDRGGETGVVAQETDDRLLRVCLSSSRWTASLPRVREQAVNTHVQVSTRWIFIGYRNRSVSDVLNEWNPPINKDLKRIWCSHINSEMISSCHRKATSMWVEFGLNIRSTAPALSVNC